MSHFTEIRISANQKYETEFVAALEQEFGEGNVEVSNDGLPLHGYTGDNRSKLDTSNPNYAPLCHIRIRKHNVGSAANDVGYRRNAQGTYDAYISEFDSWRNFNQDRQNRVAEKYAELSTRKVLKAKGYTVVEKKVKDKNGVEHLRLTGKKWV